MPAGQGKPRLWVRLFVNPLIHKKGRGSKICWKTRMDVLPFNKFELGEKSTIEDFATVNNGLGDVIIGQRTRIGLGNVIIGPVNIGHDVILAQNIVVSAMNHGYADVAIPIKNQACSKDLITIADECWIGANCVITAGVNIGKHSVVAGGSVVVKDVPAYSIVAGNPARVIKQFNFESMLWEKIKA